KACIEYERAMQNDYGYGDIRKFLMSFRKLDYTQAKNRKLLINTLVYKVLVSFVGEEVRVQVGNRDFYIDLVFLNRELSCLVAIELKADEFRPEHIGQMQFYLEALDRDFRKSHENPSVGLILCASKNDAIVEYALSKSLAPNLVAAYEFMLPNKELLQSKLKEIANLSQEDND
ncbi:MAG: DUF1016 domain-containing protein, partial [Firmicutes bacterium]|nr:DUF1016 domain-containing protein [Bacillota bacterium]